VFAGFCYAVLEHGYVMIINISHTNIYRNKNG